MHNASTRCCGKRFRAAVAASVAVAAAFAAAQPIEEPAERVSGQTAAVSCGFLAAGDDADRYLIMGNHPRVPEAIRLHRMWQTDRAMEIAEEIMGSPWVVDGRLMLTPCDGYTLAARIRPSRAEALHESCEQRLIEAAAEAPDTAENSARLQGALAALRIERALIAIEGGDAVGWEALMAELRRPGCDASFWRHSAERLYRRLTPQHFAELLKVAVEQRVPAAMQEPVWNRFIKLLERSGETEEARRARASMWEACRSLATISVMEVGLKLAREAPAGSPAQLDMLRRLVEQLGTVWSGAEADPCRFDPTAGRINILVNELAAADPRIGPIEQRLRAVFETRPPHNCIPLPR